MFISPTYSRFCLQLLFTQRFCLPSHAILMIPKIEGERGIPMYSSNIPRCQHIKVNGTQCGSPAVRDRRFCFFHKKWHDQRIVINSAQARQSPPTLDLPVLEDANSIQVALMQVMRLLLTAQIEHRTAGLLLYALQTASANLARTSFEPELPTRVVIDRATVARRPIGATAWSTAKDREYDDQDENKQDSQPESLAKILLERMGLANVKPILQREYEGDDEEQDDPGSSIT